MSAGGLSACCPTSREFTTRRDKDGLHAADLVVRRFLADAPNKITTTLSCPLPWISRGAAWREWRDDVEPKPPFDQPGAAVSFSPALRSPDADSCAAESMG